MNPSVEIVGDVAVVEIHIPEIDLGNVEELKSQVSPVLDRHSNLVLDMNSVRFIDSSGCAAVISFLKRARSQGGEFRLCRLTTAVLHVIELIRLHRICDVFDTREEAIAAFRDD